MRNFAIIKLTPIMQKIFTVILFLISAVFSIKAVDSKAVDSLEIYYDGLYAVNRTVNVYPVADVFSFPQDHIDNILEALNIPQKEILADGKWILWYYLDTSFQEARSIKSDIEKVDLPKGYKWGFGILEDENQKLTFIVALCESKSTFSDTIYQAFLEENVFAKPSVRFNFRQGESEESLEEYKKYSKGNNHLVFEINDWLFSYSQIKDNDGSITIDYVPRSVLEKLYKSPRFDVPELIAE